MILSQSLLNNVHVKRQNEPIYSKSLYDKGLWVVLDLFDEQRRLKSWERMSQEFRPKPTEFLESYGIIVSIQLSWRRAIRNRSSIEVDSKAISSHYISLFIEK